MHACPTFRGIEVDVKVTKPGVYCKTSCSMFWAVVKSNGGVSLLVDSLEMKLSCCFPLIIGFD